MSNVSQLAAAHLRTVTAVLPGPARSLSSLPSVPSIAEGVLRLPEGAIVAPWPQAALPVDLSGAEVPMVGYLVLVPAERVAVGAPPVGAAQPSGPASGSAPTSGLAPVSSLRAVPDSPGGPAGTAGLRLDLERRTARLDGVLLELTYLEFELLAHFTANPHRVHSRDHLVTAVWGYGHIGDGRTVDVHVARLRRKLGARYRAGIVTVRRVGYKYVPPKQA